MVRVHFAMGMLSIEGSEFISLCEVSELSRLSRRDLRQRAEGILRVRNIRRSEWRAGIGGTVVATLLPA